jgi:hypothetical protein
MDESQLPEYLREYNPVMYPHRSDWHAARFQLTGDPREQQMYADAVESELKPGDAELLVGTRKMLKDLGVDKPDDVRLKFEAERRENGELREQLEEKDAYIARLEQMVGELSQQIDGGRTAARWLRSVGRAYAARWSR